MDNQPNDSWMQVTSILREEMAQRRLKNPSYSTRAFARDAGLSPGFLSLVLAGKKRISLERAEALARILGMNDRMRRKFLRAVTLSSVRGGSGMDIVDILDTPKDVKDSRAMALDQFQYFSSWYYVAIADLTTCRGFRPDISWIAQRLGLDDETVKFAVDRLLRLGVLRWENGKMIKTDRHVSVPAQAPHSAIRTFHEQMISKARENLGLIDPEDYVRRLITGLTFAIPEDKIEEAKTKINAFKREMATLTEDDACDALYQMNIQFFPLTKKESPQ